MEDCDIDEILKQVKVIKGLEGLRADTVAILGDNNGAGEILGKLDAGITEQRDILFDKINCCGNIEEEEVVLDDNDDDGT